MAFKAVQLKDHAPILGNKYLFDANAWIFIIEADLELRSADKKAEQYVALLEKIGLAGSPKPKVVLPAIIISEVVNRLIRSYYFPIFKREYPSLLRMDDRYDYKHVYRKHERFATDYGIILYNIKSYHRILELVDDGFSQNSIKNVLTKPDTTLDFNDFVLVQIAQRNQYIVVSDDSDLAGRDITLVTSNSGLLRGYP